jgi:hypothetical protein
MVDVNAPAFQTAIATAAFAAATAATASMPAQPQAHPMSLPSGWTYQLPYQQPPPDVHGIYSPMMLTHHPVAAQPAPPQTSDEPVAAGSDAASPSTTAIESLQGSMQLLLQQHAIELEARRSLERELLELRGRHDDLLATCNKAELDKAVAVANAKAAKAAAEERANTIKKLEDQAAEWRKLATDLLKERKSSKVER